VLSIRSISLGNLGRYEEAISSFDRAIQIKSDKDQSWNNRGVALANLGRYEEAISSFDRTLQIKPDDPNSYYNKACAYSLQNQIELAFREPSKSHPTRTRRDSRNGKDRLRF